MCDVPVRSLSYDNTHHTDQAPEDLRSSDDAIYSLPAWRKPEDSRGIAERDLSDAAGDFRPYKRLC